MGVSEQGGSDQGRVFDQDGCLPEGVSAWRWVSAQGEGAVCLGEVSAKGVSAWRGCLPGLYTPPCGQNS